nr:hypothetical protein [Rhodococcus sp. 15-1154-1]
MILEPAAENYLLQQGIQNEVLIAAAEIWGARPPRDFDAWFAANVDRLVAVVVAGQEAAVAGTQGYVADTLDVLGVDVDPVADVATDSLIGTAADGRPLDSLMYGAVITAKGQIGQAVDQGRQVTSDVVAAAWKSGLYAVQLRAQTQLADANRVATGLGITSRPRIGFVRMLNPPSCSRCAVLAGRFYRFNAGFDRHPSCDCRAIPAPEDMAGDLRTDPMDYFASLDVPMQDKIFTVAGAQAIRDGADINQVVNARRGANGLDTAAGSLGRTAKRDVYGQQLITTTEGVTRRGVAGKVIRARGRNAATTPRLMPEDIYEIASSREDALRLLQLNGYVLERSGVPLSGTGSRTGLVPSFASVAAPARVSAPAAPSGGSNAKARRVAGLAASVPPPTGIVAPATRTFLGDSELSLPYGTAGWQGEAGVAIVRPRESRGARGVWRAEKKVAEITALMAEIRARSPRLGRGEFTRNSQRAEYEAQLRADIAAIDDQLVQARTQESIASLAVRRGQLEQEIADIKTERNAAIDLLGAEDTIERARLGKVGPRDHEMVPELTEFAGEYDVNGRQIPSAGLERHLDTVLAAGKALRADITRSFDTDPVLVKLREDWRAAEQALMDAESALFSSPGFSDSSHPLWKPVDAAKTVLFQTPWEREIRRRESLIIRSALGEVRDFGGVEMPARIAKASEIARDRASAGSARVMRDLRASEQYFPRDWLDRAVDRGELALFQSDRAFFNSDGPGGGDMIAAPTRAATENGNRSYDGAYDGYETEVMVHELGHRMEMAVPGLTELEFALVRRRAMTSGVLDDLEEFSAGEFSLRDRWRDPYTGRVYNSGSTPQSQDAHEAFQTGTQDLFGRGSRKFGDDELEEFMLGTLALL